MVRKVGSRETNLMIQRTNANAEKTALRQQYLFLVEDITLIFEKSIKKLIRPKHKIDDKKK